MEWRQNMTWLLVHIMLVAGDVKATIEGEFKDMNDCFWARDYLANERLGEDGFFPPNEQGICVAKINTAE